jgi:transcriptional regulator with XRE-family HTH domain
MSFAEALRTLMDQRGFTTNGLAAKVPCDKALISRYRNGRQQPSERMARRVDDVEPAEALSRSPFSLPGRPVYKSDIYPHKVYEHFHL